MLTSVNGVVGGRPDDGQSQSGKEEELRIGIGKLLLLGQKRELCFHLCLSQLSFHCTNVLFGGLDS